MSQQILTGILNEHELTLIIHYRHHIKQDEPSEGKKFAPGEKYGTISFYVRLEILRLPFKGQKVSSLCVHAALFTAYDIYWSSCCDLDGNVMMM